MMKQICGVVMASVSLALFVGTQCGCQSSVAVTTQSADARARLKDVAAGLNIYVEDNDQTFPPYANADRAREAVLPYVRRESSFIAAKGQLGSPSVEVAYWDWNHKLAGKRRFNLAEGRTIFVKAVPTFYDPISAGGGRLVATLSSEEPVRFVSDAEWQLIEEEMRVWPDAQFEEARAPESLGAEVPSAIEVQSPKWPRAWRFASRAFGLYGKRASELEVLGEPTDIHEVKKGAWWVEEPYSGWLEGHNVFRWTQQGMQLNPHQRNSEPRARIVVGVNKRTKLISLVQFVVPGAVGDDAQDWDLTVTDAARLLGIDGEPVVTYYNQAPFGGSNLLTVFRKGDAHVAIRSFTNTLFEQSSKTDFESGKTGRSSRLKEGLRLSSLKAEWIYLGPRRTKFSFNAVNQPEVNDLLAMPFRKVAIPRGDKSDQDKGAMCRARLLQLRRYIAILRTESSRSQASTRWPKDWVELRNDSGVEAVCPAEGRIYSFSSETGVIRCSHPGHQAF